ncbi:MAG: gliding motility-associated C-terminal domain-containing protein [Bacteroidota bacterium]
MGPRFRKQTILFFILLVFLFQGVCLFGQDKPWANPAPMKPASQAFFTAPDTVCMNMPVNVVNGSTATTYSWTFATANTYTPPEGQNFFNSGNRMKRPKFITIVNDSGLYFTFVTSAGNRSIIMIKNGSSLMNPPISTVPIFYLGILSDKMRGIQIRLDTLKKLWVGFFTSGNSLTRMVFQNGLSKSPSIMDIPFPGVSASSGLIIAKEGNQWIGFAVDSVSNTISRLRFDTTLLKLPAVDALGNIGNLNGPTGICHVKQNGENYLFICNSENNTLSRIDFNGSLLSTPTGVNLGNISGILDHNVGISILADCQHVNGIVCNWSTAPRSLVQLNFAGGIKGTITATLLDTTGTPYRPYGVSELIRIADTVFAFYVNEGNSTLSQLNFPPGNAAVPPSSTLQQPGPVIYTDSGDYNIILRTDLGLPGAGSYCKPIHVLPELTVSLGGDRTICQGVSARLDAGPGYYSYLWSTGDTTSFILAADSMKYWVRVNNKYGCIASDTVFVHRTPAPKYAVDTTICYGQKYYAGGKYQTQSGHYSDTLSSPAGCDSILFTSLNVKPKIDVNLGPDTVLCQGDSYVLDATTPGATAYLWQDGSVIPKYMVTSPGVYWVHVTVNDCIAGDTVNIGACPYRLTFPNAFSPNADGINDTFQPVGVSILSFHMEIYDRWGVLVYTTDDISQGWNGSHNNKNCEAGVFIYDVTFESMGEPGTKLKDKGTFTLIR